MAAYYGYTTYLRTMATRTVAMLTYYGHTYYGLRAAASTP